MSALLLISVKFDWLVFSDILIIWLFAILLFAIFFSFCISFNGTLGSTVSSIWIHGFTTSVPVLILPAFWQLLLRNKKSSSKCLFWNKQTQRADNRWEQKSYFTSTLISLTLVLYNSKMALCFNWIINQTKHYLRTDRETFLQIQYGFYRNALQIRYLLW